MKTELGIDAKRLLFIHNCVGVFRVLITTFLNVFLLNSIGFGTTIVFNIVSYFVSSLMFLLLGKTANNKEMVNIYRFGIVALFLFIGIMIFFQDRLQDYFILVGAMFGIGNGAYYYSYNQLTFHFSDLDQRIKFIGSVHSWTLIINTVVPIILGYIISTYSYDFVFIFIAIMLVGLIIYSFKLNLKIRESKNHDLGKFIKTVAKKKHLRSLYAIPLLQGFSAGALDGLIIPTLIFMTFNSEFSLGVLSSIFNFVSIFIALLISKKIVGKLIVKLTSVSLIGRAINSCIYLLPLTSGSLIFANVINALFWPMLNFGYSHYGFNIIDIEHLGGKSVEHFVFRELLLNTGKLFAYILTLGLVIFSNDNSDLYRVMVCVLTVPSLFVIYHINVVEKHVVKVLDKENKKKLNN